MQNLNKEDWHNIRHALIMYTSKELLIQVERPKAERDYSHYDEMVKVYDKVRRLTAQEIINESELSQEDQADLNLKKAIEGKTKRIGVRK